MGFLKFFGSKENEQIEENEHRKDVKDTFLADQHRVVHDLKTPLNGISGMAQLLRETPLNQEQSEYVSVIEESITAMLQQINTLSGQPIEVSHYKAVEIRRFLQHILALMRESVDAYDFGIHYKIDRKFPMKLMLEESVLQEVMLGVFDTLFAVRKKDLVMEAIYQADDGYGLLIMRDKALTAEDELNGVKDLPFSQELLEDIEGSSLRYNLMKTVDGKIKFELYAYYQQDEVEQVQRESREVSSALIEEIKEEKPQVIIEDDVELSNLPTILIAEDEVVGRVTLKLMLKERYNIIFAKNGKEAVDLYFKKKPCLVLMDIMMPLMNGFEAFDEIEKRDKFRKPIIACTSKVISTEREYLTSYGFDDHLDKPIEHVKLDEILMKYTNV